MVDLELTAQPDIAEHTILARQPSLRHVRRMTDDCGMIQHARYWFPKYDTGYCVDDNSRALLVAAQYFRLFNDEQAHELMLRYLAFIRYVQRRDGQVRNFVSYTREYLEPLGSLDSHGRTLWALGYVASFPEEHLRIPAQEMFQRLLPHMTPDLPPHSLAYALLGLCAYGTCEACRQEARHRARPLADALVRHYLDAQAEGWEWFLPELTYGNARLPQALLGSWQLLGEATYLEIGMRTLDFLHQETIMSGMLSVIGSRGWYRRGGQRAIYDQQPIDAGAMVEANLLAYQITQQQTYLDDALTAMAWFYGRNLGGLALADVQSGGCCDGLCRQGVNKNQGAESTLALLLAQLALYAAYASFIPSTLAASPRTML
ncbi:MAG: glycosyltransferase [Armatimonadota bacterium]